MTRTTDHEAVEAARRHWAAGDARGTIVAAYAALDGSVDADDAHTLGTLIERATDALRAEGETPPEVPPLSEATKQRVIAELMASDDAELLEVVAGYWR